MVSPFLPGSLPKPTSSQTMKPGIKTTEFWLTVATSVGAALAAAANVLPEQWAAIAITVSNVAYAISRGMAKAINGHHPDPNQ